MLAITFPVALAFGGVTVVRSPASRRAGAVAIVYFLATIRRQGSRPACCCSPAIT